MSFVKIQRLDHHLEQALGSSGLEGSVGVERSSS